jgi:PKHD-type hydroxylase
VIVLQQVFAAIDVAAARDALAMAEFVDGKLSAGHAASRVKNNLQLKRPGLAPMPLDRLIVAALASHAVMQAYALPKIFAAPIYSKYVPGMRYGAHVDAAMLGGERPIRTDLSVTLFLSDPETYDGGELVIDSDAGPKAFKLRAGDAVVYATFALHEVKEVTRGERLAAVTWCQSLVRDPQMRRVLFDLAAVVESLEASAPDAPETKLAEKALCNLQRLVMDV